MDGQRGYNLNPAAFRFDPRNRLDPRLHVHFPFPFSTPIAPTPSQLTADAGRDRIIQLFATIPEIQGFPGEVYVEAMMAAEVGKALEPVYPLHLVRFEALAALRDLARQPPRLMHPQDTLRFVTIRGRAHVLNQLRTIQDIGGLREYEYGEQIWAAEAGKQLIPEYPVAAIRRQALGALRALKRGRHALFPRRWPVVDAPPPGPPPIQNQALRTVSPGKMPARPLVDPTHCLGPPIVAPPPGPFPRLDMDEIVQRVTEMFPRVERHWIEERARRRLGIGGIVEEILDPNVPVPLRHAEKREPKKAEPAVAEPVGMFAGAAVEVDYFRRPLRFQLDAEYQQAAERALADRFRGVSLPSLRAVLKTFGWNFAPAFQAVQDAVNDDDFLARYEAHPDEPTAVPTPLGPDRGQANWTFTRVSSLKMLKRIRKPKDEVLPAGLAVEVAWVDERAQGGASGPAPIEGPADADTVECEICYEEQPAAEFASCRAGHSACLPCFRRQATEAVYGQGAAAFACLEAGCVAGFGQAELGRILNADQAARLAERAGHQAIAAADISNFAQCKYCPWGAVFDAPPDVDKVFRCGGCSAAFCRLCERDWDDEHIGRKCEELETDAATAARKRLEEDLSAAILRRCHKCGLQFQKLEGCNKMTCTCKATSCYICRTPDIGYDHFCRHPRDPGFGCRECRACSLWEDAARVDAERLRAVAQDV